MHILKNKMYRQLSYQKCKRQSALSNIFKTYIQYHSYIYIYIYIYMIEIENIFKLKMQKHNKNQNVRTSLIHSAGQTPVEINVCSCGGTT